MSAPSGTVTFLFTDIDGSTRLWQAGEEVMRATDLLSKTLGMDRPRELRAEGKAMDDDNVVSTAFDLIAAAQSVAQP